MPLGRSYRWLLARGLSRWPGGPGQEQLEWGPKPQELEELCPAADTRSAGACPTLSISQLTQCPYFSPKDRDGGVGEAMFPKAEGIALRGPLVCPPEFEAILPHQDHLRQATRSLCASVSFPPDPAAHGMRKFPSQGPNPLHSSHQNQSRDNSDP